MLTIRRLIGWLLFGVGQVVGTREYTLKTTGEKQVDVKRSITEIPVTSIKPRSREGSRRSRASAAGGGRLRAALGNQGTETAA
jgi:hypothetical protein